MSENGPAFAWGHVNLNVEDLERSIAFYALFGFEVFMPSIPYLGLVRDEVRTLGDDNAAALGVPAGTRGRACILGLGQTFPKLDLTEFEMEDAREPLSNADLGLVRLCLASQDLQADYETLTAAGVEFISAPKKAKHGLADIGAHPFAQPGNQVKADKGTDRHQPGQAQDEIDGGVELLEGFLYETSIDQYAYSLADRKCDGGSKHQGCDGSKQLTFVGLNETPQL